MKIFYSLILFVLPFFGIAQSVTTYNRSAWTVATNSEELTGDLPNGPAIKLLDGDNTSFWVSRYTTDFAGYPYTLVFDMKVAQPVNQLYTVPRQGNGTTAYSGSVSFSDDGINFGAETPVVFSNYFAQNIINLSATQNHRYFRITVNQNYDDHNAGSNSEYITTLAEVGALYNTTFDNSLNSFAVQAQATAVQLNWSTTSETSSSSFNITRSADAASFTTIGTVTATGTATTAASYSFTDASPLTGTNFYRLELVHTSGPTEQSRIVNTDFPIITYSSTQPKNLNVFYFLPAGKGAYPNFKTRISGVMLGLQNYYKTEMQRNGRGAKTFSLVTDDATHQQVKIIVVQGKFPFDNYTRDAGGGDAIQNEIDAYIAANPSAYYGSHNITVTPAFGYDAATGIVDERVPVYGVGKNCYTLDYPTLDYSYLGASSVEGEAATVNIGGTAHEGGHSFGLSHNKLKVSETALGTALMSDGNYTYGKTTTSLTATDAAILNRCQVFNDASISYYGPKFATITSVHACFSVSKNAVIIAGRTATTGAQVTDIAIYNDPNNGSSPGMGDNKDYDAVTWTAPIIGTDSFYIEMPINELQVNDSSLYEMKIRLIQRDGNLSDTKYHYDFANNLPELNDPSFTPISAIVTASATGNGSILPAGATTINCVGSQTYTITPVTGYNIQDVLVDGVSAGAISTYTFTGVNRNHTISATFTSSLPIDLISFDVTPQGKNNALLAWQTASETDNKGYEIQMSQDGSNYKVKGFVQGNGTTSSVSNYKNVVANLAEGVYYFRLKMIDIDGQFTYSPVRSIKITNAEADIINVYPNPSKDGSIFISLNGYSTNIKMIIINSVGQLINTINYPVYSSPLKVKLPAPGVYTIQVITSDGTTIVKKVINLK